MIFVALAILEQDGRFLMQLRDDIPTILYPGVWGLFGGHLEAGESPEIGLKRELKEEINYEAPSLRYFRSYNDDNLSRYLYHVPLTLPLEKLVQTEGQDLALLPPDAIRQGEYYSEKINQTRSLGKIHRQILLDFLEVEL
ncbi:NUDIX hydrolase [Microcystis aeruginosa]|uniref:CTP pyrophosphohydrolase n=1 Tax=Microcystis aeruginosa NIES-2521 TaxID=2303983 RepID=A0A5A5RYV7_MICAE|nr:NUDIX hydrolase [Microcystis aeruginosa]GCA80145.1 CTP pyrophosphohydrolase [Microcystis aeruginosa NIES-2521]